MKSDTHKIVLECDYNFTDLWEADVDLIGSKLNRIEISIN